MSKPTITFDEWMAQRDALMAHGKYAEATNLVRQYTILGTLGEPLNPEPAPEVLTRAEGDARQARIKRIIETSGVNRAEAERRIAVADGTTPKSLTDMAADPTSPEAIEAARYLLGSNYQDNSGDSVTVEEFTADWNALRDSMVEANRPIFDGEDVWANVAKATAEREAAAAKEAKIAEGVETLKALNPHASPEQIEAIVRTRVG